jgi:hypothetical protein
MATPRCWAQIGCDPPSDSPESRRYRYSLTYGLKGRGGLPPLVVIQLNPSTAGAEAEDAGDATSRRVAGWASRRGRYGSVVFLNLFGAKCTDPKGLLQLSYDEAVGPRGDLTLAEESNPSDATVVAAWGKWNTGALRALVGRRRDQVCDLLSDKQQTLHWLAPTGHPLHGLRWEDRHDLEPIGIPELRDT